MKGTLVILMLCLMSSCAFRINTRQTEPQHTPTPTPPIVDEDNNVVPCSTEAPLQLESHKQNVNGKNKLPANIDKTETKRNILTKNKKTNVAPLLQSDQKSGQKHEPFPEEVKMGKTKTNKNKIVANKNKNDGLLNIMDRHDLLENILHRGDEKDTRTGRNTAGSLSWNSAFGQYETGSVAADVGTCSQIGVDILQQGGSATDAAIAAMICVGTINLHNTGVGGGHFATIYDTPNSGGEKVVTTILARETAPGAAHRDMFVNNTDASHIGGLSIGVPGEVSGFYTAWQKFGRLPWSSLIQPSITLCQQGFTVTSTLASAIRSYEFVIRADPNLSELLVKSDGSLYVTGDTMVNIKYGATLERIASNPMGFYTGDLARDIISDIEEYDGIIKLSDLAGYRTKEKDPLTVTLSNGGYTLNVPRLPSSGIVHAFMLNILDGYNFNNLTLAELDSRILNYHRIAEAFKFGYAKRSKMGDEDYVDVQELMANLTSDDYCDATRLQINDTHTQDVSYYGPGFEARRTGGTAHLSVLAADGSAVAMTSTINLFFGSKVRGSRTGIMFNDEMDDFSTPGTVNSFGVPASPENYIVPGKMPMSSMCPTIVLDSSGNVVHVTGASGGTRITTGTAFNSIENIWFGKRLDAAIDTYRFHHQLMPDRIEYEVGFEQEVLDGLANKGHEIRTRSNVGVVNVIDNACRHCGNQCQGQTCIHAASDGRRGGAPAGY